MELETEIGNLAQHFFAGAVSLTLLTMLADREAEKDRLVRQLGTWTPDGPTVIPHPTLVATYECKVRACARV